MYDQLKTAARVLALVLLATVLPAQGGNDDLRLLTYSDPPYVYPNGDHFKEHARGLAILYIKQLMAKAAIPYSLDILPPKRALLVALSTPNTCVFPIERSQEREVKFSWVSPVLISRHGFFKRPDSPSFNLRTIRDAEKLTIGTYLGSGIGEYLRTQGFQVDETNSNESNIHKLQAKRIDLWASDVLSAQYIANKNDLVLAEPELVFFTSLRAMGCNLSVSDEKIHHLNQTLKLMYQEGDIEKIQREFTLQYR